MLARILLVVAVLIGGYFFTRRLHRFPWRAPGSRLLVAAGMILLLLLLTVRGGAEVAVPLLAVPALFLVRWLNARSPPSPVDPAQPGSVGYSTVTTRFLSMKLNHATGAMTGQVLEGRFVGCSLRDLPLRDLLAFGGSARMTASRWRFWRRIWIIMPIRTGANRCGLPIKRQIPP